MKKQDNMRTKKSQNKKGKLLLIFLAIIMFTYALTFIYALSFGLITSLKSPNEWLFGDPMTGTGPNILGLPDIELSERLAKILGTNYSLFGNYSYVIKSFKFIPNSVSYYTLFGTKVEHIPTEVGLLDYLFNTFMYAVVCPMLSTLVTAVSAYLCCKYKYKYSSFLYVLLLTVMAIPIVGTGPSTIVLLRQLGLFDTYAGMIVQSFHFTGLYFFVFFAFYQGLSDTYIEAAEIDGASQLSILVKIILPLSWKNILTVFIMSFVACWNMYETPLLYYPTKPTLAYGIYWMSNSTSNTNIDTQSAPVKLAGCMALSIPTLIIFICLKNIIMGNLTLGGLKE